MDGTIVLANNVSLFFSQTASRYLIDDHCHENQENYCSTFSYYTGTEDFVTRVYLLYRYLISILYTLIFIIWLYRRTKSHDLHAEIKSALFMLLYKQNATVVGLKLKSETLKKNLHIII